MLFQRLTVFSVLLTTAIQVSAEEKKPAHKTMEAGKVIHVSYGSASWNTDSTKIDTASVVLRDKNTGKLIQIQLEETEPDSSQFTGRFSLNLGDQGITPEIFIPPKELRGTDKDNHKLFELVQSGKLPRKPVIWKKNEKGQPTIDVYDTREQAEAALKAYEAEQKLGQELRKKKPGVQMSDAAATAAAKAAEHKALLDKLALDAAKRAADRVHMEQVEQQRALEREEKQRKMSEAERARRREDAAKLNDEANEFYTQGEFVKAEAKYKQAVELDPDTKEYFYKYGICLYRNKKYNEASVALKLAKVDASKELEKKYYMALIFYRLAEYDNAYRQFEEVGKANDADLSPSALFYSGVILFSQEKYDAAKRNFEKVLDTSKDPAIDEQAEQYIDRIAAAMAFQKLRENKFTASAVLGMMYDSNILLSPDSLPGGGKPAGSADARLLTLFDLQYRPIFNERHELAPHVTANLTNSAKTANAVGDPFVYTLAAPYTYKSAKNNRYTLTPGYELLYMDPTNTGTKTQQLSSYYLDGDFTLMVSPTWISVYSLEYRNDKSLDPTSVGPDDLSSTKYTLRTTQMTFLDKAKKQALIPSLGYIMNKAKGANKTYNRYDLGVTYVRPISWGLGWTAGLSYYNMKYPNIGRTDTDYSFTTGVSKPLRDWVVWGLTGSYTKNSSTDPSFTYTKYLIMTTFAFSTNF
ncbi:MAG: tetratricopeptide repeat protein [Bdellovibrionales bacterium]